MGIEKPISDPLYIAKEVILNSEAVEILLDSISNVLFPMLCCSGGCGFYC